jgi:hypothetical protein
MHKPARIYGFGKVCGEVISQSGKKRSGTAKRKGAAEDPPPHSCPPKK